MGVDPKTLGLNLHIVIGAVILGSVLLVLLLAVLTGLNIGIWQLRRKAAEDEERRRKSAPDGTSLPPSGAGLCDRCGAAPDAVFFLPDGQRRCRECYFAERGLKAAPGRRPAPSARRIP